MICESYYHCVGMTRREVLDTYLRDRAISYGTNAINALVTGTYLIL